jgi:hypothetical protein
LRAPSPRGRKGAGGRGLGDPRFIVLAIFGAARDAEHDELHGDCYDDPQGRGNRRPPCAETRFLSDAFSRARASSFFVNSSIDAARAPRVEAARKHANAAQRNK